MPEEPIPLSEREERILDLLEERPFSLQEIAEKLGMTYYHLNLMEEMVRRFAIHLFKRRLDETVDPDDMEQCEVCRIFLQAILDKSVDDFEIDFKMRHPVIGIGTPIAHFLPAAAKRLNAGYIIPEHADVANAIGAVISRVRVERHAKIRPCRPGGFLVEGLRGAKRFSDRISAMTWTEEQLKILVTHLTEASGTEPDISSTELKTRITDDVHTAPTGEETFLGRTLTVELIGTPVSGYEPDIGESIPG